MSPRNKIFSSGMYSGTFSSVVSARGTLTYSATPCTRVWNMVSAIRADPTACREWGHYFISLLKILNAFSNIFYKSHKLMSNHKSFVHRNATSVEVQIRAADCAFCNSKYYIILVLNLWIGNCFNPDVFNAMIGCGFHPE